jgi:hypothetical protein
VSKGPRRNLGFRQLVARSRSCYDNQLDNGQSASQMRRDRNTRSRCSPFLPRELRHHLDAMSSSIHHQSGRHQPGHWRPTSRVIKPINSSKQAIKQSPQLRSSQKPSQRFKRYSAPPGLDGWGIFQPTSPPPPRASPNPRHYKSRPHSPSAFLSFNN